MRLVCLSAVSVAAPHAGKKEKEQEFSDAEKKWGLARAEFLKALSVDYRAL